MRILRIGGRYEVVLTDAEIRELNGKKGEFVSPGTEMQPDPSGGGHDIANLVQLDIEARAQKGEQTYGERLKPNNGRDALVDAYQEALDLAMYLRQAIEERKAKPCS